MALIVSDATDNLSGARIEVDDVLKATQSIPESQVSNEINVLRDAVNRCSLLHVAAHGLWNDTNPFLSGVIVSEGARLSGPFVRYTDLSGGYFDKPGEDRWRLWTVGELMANGDLDLCRLAVLSSCESAISHNHASGEMAGLPNAFLLAGARSVIGSMWPVHDGAAAVLMHHFYKIWANMAGDHPSAARALGEARQALRRTSRHEALSILGDPSLIPPPQGDEALPDELVFSNPLYTDAFCCYGAS